MLRLLRSNPPVRVAELAETLAASRETVRHDLIVLEEQGLIRRDRGKATLADSQSAIEALRIRGGLPREQRHLEILRLLKERRVLRSTDLARFLNVSSGTVRNDLLMLEQQGRIHRRHGSVVARGDDRIDALLSSLVGGPFAPSVRHVGDRAVSLIEGGDLVFLDDSLFGCYIAASIPLDRDASIATISPRAALILATREYNADVFLLPGLAQKDGIAVDAEFRALVANRFLFTKAFFGVASHAADRGFFTENRKQAETFSFVMKIAQAVYLEMDSRNVGSNGKYGLIADEPGDLVKEVLIDDGLTVERAAREFGERVPVVLCGENYALKSPFNKQYTIGFAALHGKTEFSRLVREGLETAAAGHTSVEVIVADNRMDREATLANIETFIEKKVDLVIEYQHDYSLSTLIGEKLSHADIPVIAVDVPIPGAIYFGANNYRAGIMGGEAAAEEAVRRWGGEVDRLIVMSDAATGPLPESRVTGMLEAFCRRVPFPQDRIVRLDSENDPEAVEMLLGELLKMLPVRARTIIFSINSNVTIGVLNALARLGDRENTIVVGQNVTPAIIKELARPDTHLLGAVGYFPERYGERIIALALSILGKKPVSPDNYTEHQWIGRTPDTQPAQPPDNRSSQ